MKGARRIHGIISSRSEQLPLCGFLELRNLLQNGPDQRGVGKEAGNRRTGPAAMDWVSSTQRHLHLTHFF